MKQRLPLLLVLFVHWEWWRMWWIHLSEESQLMWTVRWHAAVCWQEQHVSVRGDNVFSVFTVYEAACCSWSTSRQDVYAGRPEGLSWTRTAHLSGSVSSLCLNQSVSSRKLFRMQQLLRKAPSNCPFKWLQTLRSLGQQTAADRLRVQVRLVLTPSSNNLIPVNKLGKKKTVVTTISNEYSSWHTDTHQPDRQQPWWKKYSNKTEVEVSGSNFTDLKYQLPFYLKNVLYHWIVVIIAQTCLSLSCCSWGSFY